MNTIDSEYIAEIIAQAYFNINIIQNKKILNYFHTLKTDNDIQEQVKNSILENAACAEKYKIPLCQDTGTPIIFIETGKDTYIKGDIEQYTYNAISDISLKKGLRASIVENPLNKKRKLLFNKPVIHIIPSHRTNTRITVMAKGGGSENVTQMTMMNPSSERDAVADFAVNALKEASSRACPPYIMGIGIGGSVEQSALKSKMALSGKFGHNRKHDEKYIAALILEESKKLNIGVQGLGFGDTLLDCRIIITPSHITSLPVTVSFSCFQERVKTIIL